MGDVVDLHLLLGDWRIHESLKSPEVQVVQVHNLSEKKITGIPSPSLLAILVANL